MASQEILRQRIKTGGAAVRVRAAGASLLKDEARLSVIGPLNDLWRGATRWPRICAIWCTCQASR
jgi:hypothetical protein